MLASRKRPESATRYPSGERGLNPRKRLLREWHTLHGVELRRPVYLTSTCALAKLIYRRPLLACSSCRRMAKFLGANLQSQTGDYSDVEVLTPVREIQWNELSRIDD